MPHNVLFHAKIPAGSLSRTLHRYLICANGFCSAFIVYLHAAMRHTELRAT